jgi:GNAT superfamily N-acetyltransferase
MSLTARAPRAQVRSCQGFVAPHCLAYAGQLRGLPARQAPRPLTASVRLTGSVRKMVRYHERISGRRGRVRRVHPDEFVALFELEKAASLAGLGHVFPVEKSPFPDQEVLAKYRLWFEDPDFKAVAVELGRTLIGHAAYDREQLRQLSVHPEHWGSGLAGTLVEAALDDMAAGGAEQASLWVLTANARARHFYQRTGWVSTGKVSRSQFVPHPDMLEYVRHLSERRARRVEMG